MRAELSFGRQRVTWTGPGFSFRLDAPVAQRFNAYAAAAAPKEIGGLLRVRRLENGTFLACDLKVFPQEASTAAFELDSTAVAVHQMELARDGRGEEAREWCALIHSHPGYGTKPSSTDLDQVAELAGDSFAFSVICATTVGGMPANNRYCALYAQASPVPLVLADVDVVSSSRESLRGLALLGTEELDTIQAHVQELLDVAHKDGYLRDLQAGGDSADLRGYEHRSRPEPQSDESAWLPADLHGTVLRAHEEAGYSPEARERIALELQDRWPPPVIRRRCYLDALNAARAKFAEVEDEDAAEYRTALTQTIDTLERWHHHNLPPRRERAVQRTTDCRDALDDDVVGLLREQCLAHGQHLFSDGRRAEHLESAIRLNRWRLHPEPLADAISLLMFSRKQLTGAPEANAQQLALIKQGLTALSTLAGDR